MPLQTPGHRSGAENPCLLHKADLQGSMPVKQSQEESALSVDT